MTEREPLPDKLSLEDAMTQALVKGHAMGTFRSDPTLGWRVATCNACGCSSTRTRQSPARPC